MNKYGAFGSVLFIALVGYVMSLAVVTVADYYFVEVFMRISYIPAWINTMVVIILTLTLSFFWSKQKYSTKSFFVIVLLLGVSIGVSFVYRQKKAYAAIAPKIFYISPNRGLQSQYVTIRGVRFLPSEKKGKAYLGKDELLIQDWQYESILAEQQLPSEYGWTSLYLVSSEGKISNKVPFYIPDLKNLKQP